MEQESQEYLELADNFQDTVMSKDEADCTLSLNTRIMPFHVLISEPCSIYKHNNRNKVSYYKLLTEKIYFSS